jgi:hypothetical protein
LAIEAANCMHCWLGDGEKMPWCIVAILPTIRRAFFARTIGVEMTRLAALPTRSLLVMEDER